MRYASWALITVLTWLPTSGALGAAPPAADAEIGYLLDYLGASGCEFYRNGTWYDALTAQAHLRGKYARLAAFARIGSAEDFIEQAATRSSLSGEAYAVRCGPTSPIGSNLWLREQLARYRKEGPAAAPREARGAPLIEPVR
jgi:hypothetical protein